MRALVPVVVLLACAPALAEEAARPAGNPFLLAARRLYVSLEYEKALEQLDRARAYPGTTPAELVEIEKYTGLVKFELGDVEAAKAAFRTALALDPATEIPADVSPKIKAEWTALQREMKKMDQVQAREDAHPKPPEPKVEARPEPKPEAKPPEAKPEPKPQVALAEPPKQVDLAPVPRPEPVGAVAAPAPRPSAPSMVSAVGPFAVLGLGAVLGGVGGYMGYSSGQESKQAQSSAVQLDAQAHDSTAHGRATAANVLYAAAGAAVVGGVIWLLAR